MRRSPLIFVAAALLLGVSVAGMFYYFYRTSPRYALEQMVTALTKRNYDTFYSYLDMQSILGSLMQDTGKDLIPQELIPKGDFFGELGVKMGTKVLQHVAPKIFETLQKDVFNKIINKYLEGLTTEDLLALQAAVALAEINQQGDMAQVTLRFPQYQDNGNLRLTMSRTPPDRTWRVTSLRYEDLKKLLKKSLE